MNQKNFSTVKIGAILLFAAAALRIIFNLSNNSSISGLSWLYYLGTIAIGVGLLKNNYLISTISSAICALSEVFWFFQAIKYKDVWQGILYELSYLIAFIILIVLILPYLSSSMSKEVHKLWFLPGAVLTVGYLPLLLYSTNNYYNYLSNSFKYVFVTLLFIAGMFFVGHGICNPSTNISGSVGHSAQTSSTLTSSSAPTATATPIATEAKESISSDMFIMLRKYKELLDAGIITQEEFDEKKKALLS